MRISTRTITLSILVVNIFLLVFVKLPSLSDPYYWDEMGVYGNGVQFMYENEVGLHPKFLPPEISRGHPLLLYTFHTMGLKIFGNSFLVSHTLALLLSITCLLSLYILAKEFIPPIFAALCSTLLLVQNIFIAQSSFILPEISITLVSIWAFIFYFRKDYFKLALVLCIGILIKESSILIGAFFGFIYLFDIITTKQFHLKWSNLLYFLSPLALFLLFLAVQKATHGWYFFPYHTEIVKDDALASYWIKLIQHYHFIFFKQGRNQWLIFIGIAFIVMFISKNKIKLFYLFSFSLFSLLMFSFAFYMDRYLLFTYPLLAILVVSGVYHLPFKNLYKVILIIMLAGLSILDWKNDSFQYDVSLSYRDSLKSQTETITYLCSISNKSVIIHSDFPVNMALGDTTLSKIMAPCKLEMEYSWVQEEANILVQFNNNLCSEDYSLIKKIENKSTCFYVFEKKVSNAPPTNFYQHQLLQ